jgi:hypothetical protein
MYGILRAVRLAKMIGEEAFSKVTAFSLTVESGARSKTDAEAKAGLAVETR